VAYVLTLGDTTEHDLRSLGARTNRVNIGISRTLHANERKDETKQQSEDRFADTNVELGAHERARDDERDYDADNPPPRLDAVFEWGGIEVFFGDVVGVADKDALEGCTEVAGTLDALPERMTTRHGNLQHDCF
jgi:hypothetical protein